VAERKRAGAGVYSFRAFHVMGDTMSDLLKLSALAYKEFYYRGNEQSGSMLEGDY